MFAEGTGRLTPESASSQGNAAACLTPTQVLEALKRAAEAGDVRAATFLPTFLSWWRTIH